MPFPVHGLASLAAISAPPARVAHEFAALAADVADATLPSGSESIYFFRRSSAPGSFASAARNNSLMAPCFAASSGCLPAAAAFTAVAAAASFFFRSGRFRDFLPIATRTDRCFRRSALAFANAIQPRKAIWLLKVALWTRAAHQTVRAKGSAVAVIYGGRCVDSVW